MSEYDARNWLGFRQTSEKTTSLESIYMLPPAAEAVSLIDVAVVNHDWQNNPATLRRSIQILVDHIQYQSAQLS